LKLDGINRLNSADKLKAAESPDTSNAFFYKGKDGLLGPRKGRAVFNSTPYANTAMGIVPFYVGGVRKFIVPIDSGALTVNDAPFDNPEEGGPSGKSALYLAAPLTLTLSYSTASDSASQLFADSATLGPYESGQAVGALVEFPTFSVSYSGPGDAELDIAATIALLHSGGTGPSQEIDYVFSYSSAGAGAGPNNTMPAAPAGGESRYLFFSDDLTSYTLTGLKVTLAATYTGVSSSDFTIGGMTRIQII